MSTNATWPTELPNASDWEVYLEWQKAEATGLPIGAATATATATLYTTADVAVTGGGPVALTCVDEAAGRWRGRMPSTVSVTVGVTYKLVADLIITGGVRRRYTLFVKVVEGDG